MKVAVCFSGIPRTSNFTKGYDWPKENIENTKQLLPYDTYFSTWQSHDFDYPVDFVFPDPEINYHPYIDLRWMHKQIFMNMPFRMYRWSKGHIHQFHAHAKLMEMIPNDYDIVVRVRYDVKLNKNIDWTKWIEKSYKENTVIGFCAASEETEELKRLDKGTIPLANSVRNKYEKTDLKLIWLADHMIIYPANLFKPEMVYRSTDDYRLRPAEWGWYQVLIESNQHKEPESYQGGVTHLNTKKV